MIFLKILIGVAAVALGVYLGLPGKGGPGSPKVRGQRLGAAARRGSPGGHDERELQELERALGKPGRSSRTKRYFTPIDLLRRERRGSERRRTRRYFSTAVPSRGEEDEGPDSSGKPRG